MGSGAVIYVPIVKIGSGIQKFMARRHTEHIGLLYFFKIRK
jgi:hypothetical protein